MRKNRVWIGYKYINFPTGMEYERLGTWHLGTYCKDDLQQGFRPDPRCLIATRLRMSGMRSESTEQIIFLARIRQFHRGVTAFAIPNGGKRDPKEAARLKKEGVLAGVPDVFVAAPRGIWHGLFVEMKRQTGGRLSESQKSIKAELEAQGYKVVVAKGAEEAYNSFISYMETDYV